MKKQKTAASRGRGRRVSKGNRSKGERLEVVFAPELLAQARAVAGDSALAEFVRAAVSERVARLTARRARPRHAQGAKAIGAALLASVRPKPR